MNILIEGWRGINHSFSLVNQWQIIELLKTSNIYFKDVPFISDRWNTKDNSSGIDNNIENLIDKSLNVDEISEHLKDNFSYCWYYFYIFIFTLTLRWKKQLGDLEIYSVGMVITCHSIVNKSYEGFGLNFSEWEKDMVNVEEGGVNTMSISEITHIPRPTVVRKLNYLLKNKYISINKKKQFTINMKDQALSDTIKIQEQNISSLSDLVCKIF